MRTLLDSDECLESSFVGERKNARNSHSHSHRPKKNKKNKEPSEPYRQGKGSLLRKKSVRGAGRVRTKKREREIARLIRPIGDETVKGRIHQSSNRGEGPWRSSDVAS